MRITADMLPKEGGEVIGLFFSTVYPDGVTVEELKQSEHKLFRNIGKYFEKEVDSNGNQLL